MPSSAFLSGSVRQNILVKNAQRLFFPPARKDR